MSLNKTLIWIFDKLLSFFGPQHWWPAESKLEIIVGAILTQNISWNNVEKAILNLEDKDLLSIDGILNTDIESLALLIKPAGYYNQKSRYLKNICGFVRENYKSLDEFLSQDSIKLRNKLLKIKGIGPETADSIILYAAEKPVFVVDAYTKRIFHRLGLIKQNLSYDKVQRFFMKNLPKDVGLYNQYHALIVKLGKQNCSNKNPDCGYCPLNEICEQKNI